MSLGLATQVSSLTPGILMPMASSEFLNCSFPLGVQAWCSTRQGGVSQPPFDSLNLGDHVGDDPIAVMANRQRLAMQLGSAHPVFLKQVHGTDVLTLNANTPDGTVADACVTTQTNLACTIMMADCLPVLLTDAHGRAVAAAHAGWRGLVSGVIENTAHSLCEQAAVQPPQLQAWLGPCIGSSAFEVGPEVRAAFMAHDTPSQSCFTPHPQRADKWLADLSGLARQRLEALGVQTIMGNDGSAAWCTVHNHSRFFSYRRDGVTGRLAACIWRTG